METICSALRYAPITLRAQRGRVVGETRLTTMPIERHDGCMSRHWALFDLRIRTPRLELRVPTERLIDDIIDVALDGVHDPATMPFEFAWTDAPREELPVNTLQFYWGQLAAVTVDDWHLGLAVLVDGQVVGVQGVGASRFPLRHEVSTGSWLGLRHHGQGIGTEMRSAVLHFAFEVLGAEYALSAAWRDNAASLAVSRKLGYRENGVTRKVRRGQVDEQIELRLSRSAWEQHRRDDIEVDGFERCRPTFGLD
jgi:RimJ/RimL family protein N-acetyltransferase